MQLKLTLEYDGGGFEGWQLQPSGHRTVQGEVERALGIVLRVPTRVRGAGRTDAGVHATGQVASCPVADVPSDLGRFRASMNGVLSRDVAVTRVEIVDDAFDPRRHARRRRYVYRIWTGGARTPLWHRWSWHVPGPLDVSGMRVAASRLVGRHDFESFRGADPAPPPSTVREVFVSRVVTADDMLVYEIEATAFLKHMVRNIVGTLVDVARGHRRAESIDDLLATRDRRCAAASAPARGLVLTGVDY
jgi:tRNA pseudouridine38-40 synthase